MSNWLAHYNPNHDKLGRFAESKGSAVPSNFRFAGRMFQKKDGSYTYFGKKRYGVEGRRTNKQVSHLLNDLDTAEAKAKYMAAINRDQMHALAAKLDKLQQKGKNYTKKLDAFNKRASEFSAYLEGAKMSKSSVDNLVKEYGKIYDILYRPTQRVVADYGSVYVTSPGTAYKVKEKSK